MGNISLGVNLLYFFIFKLIGGLVSYLCVQFSVRPINRLFVFFFLCGFYLVCRKCIYDKITDEELECCPICNIDLGCVPLEKLRSALCF